MSTTSNLMDFGIRELHKGAEILKVLKTSKDHTKHLGDEVTLCFNPYSDMVFLSDENYNTASMTSDGTLEDWYVCEVCGDEGFADDLKSHGDEECDVWVEEMLSIA